MYYRFSIDRHSRSISLSMKPWEQSLESCSITYFPDFDKVLLSFHYFDERIFLKEMVHVRANFAGPSTLVFKDRESLETVCTLEIVEGSTLVAKDKDGKDLQCHHPRSGARAGGALFKDVIQNFHFKFFFAQIETVMLNRDFPKELRHTGTIEGTF